MRPALCCSCGPQLRGFPTSAASAHTPVSASKKATLAFDPLRIGYKCLKPRSRVLVASSSAPESSNSSNNNNGGGGGGGGNTTFAEFCIIESREGVKDFEKLQLKEIEDNIASRKNRIFLLMEEVRRLRIQQRIKGGGSSFTQELAKEKFQSTLPFLPPLTEKTLSQYYTFYAGAFLAIIMFGGILAPMLEVKLGLGGTSYAEFIDSVHLPSQLAEVDPIVASFCGGAVGVLSALLVVEMNGVTTQQHNRCHYCQGTGYLLCGSCAGEGSSSELALALTGAGGAVCSTCSGMGKVMCTGCLCTGKTMATEHDPRIDPFT